MYEEQSSNVRKRTFLYCVPNEDSDQTAHPRSLIGVFVVRMRRPCILGYSKCAQSEDQTVRMRAEQNLRRAYTSKGTFSDVEAQSVARYSNRHKNKVELSIETVYGRVCRDFN